MEGGGGRQENEPFSRIVQYISNIELKTYAQALYCTLLSAHALHFTKLAASSRWRSFSFSKHIVRPASWNRGALALYRICPNFGHIFDLTQFYQCEKKFFTNMFT